MKALFVALALALGLAYWLIPEPDELAGRLIRDHAYDQLREEMREIDTALDTSRLSDLSGEDLAELITLTRLTPRERLNVIFNGTRKTYNDVLHHLVLSDVRYVDVIPPTEAWALIRDHHERMSNKQFVTLAELLAHHANALSKPGLAAEILSAACENSASTSATARGMALAFRWSNQPLTAAKRLQTWLTKYGSQLVPADREPLVDLCSTLAEEGGDPNLAFDLVEAELKRLPAPTAALLQHAFDYAQQASRGMAVAPWIVRYLKESPASVLSLRQLHDAHRAAPAKLVDYQHWTGKLAQVADWNSSFDSAFDQHLRLAAMGSVESLERCVALSDFLGRDEDTVEALLLFGDVSEKPQLKLTLAGMLASLGRDNEAQPLYQQWLATHPDDRDVAFALACLFEDEGDEDKAMTAFETLVKRHPEDVASRKKLAENYIRADRHRDALQLYAALSEKDHDHYTRENYAMLAESLDDHQALLKAQLITARHDNTTEAWLDIAETAAYLDDKSEALAAMQEGLAHKPDSGGLRLAIAQIHTDADQPDLAVAVLLHDSIKPSQAGIELLLQAAGPSPNVDAVLKFVGDAEKRFKLSTSARLDLAVLCRLGGERTRSERLFDSVPLTPENEFALAEARYEAGDFEQAAVAMNAYLRSNPRAVSDDWVFLGDIFDAMGRDDDARNAYNQSLTLLTADLPGGRTTSSLTRPPPPPSPAAP